MNRVARVQNIMRVLEYATKNPGIKYIHRFELGWFRSHARSRTSSSGHNAINGVITTDRRSEVAAPTSNRIDRKEEKRQSYLVVQETMLTNRTPRNTLHNWSRSLSRHIFIVDRQLKFAYVLVDRKYLLDHNWTFWFLRALRWKKGY